MLRFSTSFATASEAFLGCVAMAIALGCSPAPPQNGSMAKTGTTTTSPGSNSITPTPAPATTPPPAETSAGQTAAQPLPSTPAPPAPASIPPAAAKVVPTTADAGTEPWIKSDELPLDFWETQYLNAAQIGTIHHSITPSKTRGTDLLNITGKTVFELQREGHKTRQTSTFESLESAKGEVERYSERVEMDGRVTEATGTVSAGVLRLTVKQNDQATQVAIPFDSKTWGPLGVYQILRRSPMQSGEQRQAKVFIPFMLKVADVQLVAGKLEETALVEGKTAPLLPVEVRMLVDKNFLRWQLWADTRGEVQKTVVLTGLNLSTFRTPREAAEIAGAAADVELFAATSVKLSAEIPAARSAERIVYAVEAEGFDPFASISDEACQTTRSVTARMAEVTVHRMAGSGEPPAGSKQTPPKSDALAASPLINSDNPLITKLAEELAGSEKSPTAVALALTRGVHGKIQKKNLSHVFDSALDVAQHLEGDCTEHAVLLTALLRNRGIPARVAAGVIYTKTQDGPAFAYHMWTEAWTGDHWLPLDAVQGEPADAGRIKFLETVLAELNPYSAMLPVLQNLGRLKISVVRAE